MSASVGPVTRPPCWSPTALAAEDTALLTDDAALDAAEDAALDALLAALLARLRADRALDAALLAVETIRDAMLLTVDRALRNADTIELRILVIRDRIEFIALTAASLAALNPLETTDCIVLIVDDMNDWMALQDEFRND